MNELQGIPKILHKVRNKLQPFWTLVDMVQINKTEDKKFFSVQSMEEQSDMAVSRRTEIIQALEEVEKIAGEYRYTEDDVANAYLAGIKNTQVERQLRRNPSQYIADYNETKSSNNQNTL